VTTITLAVPDELAEALTRIGDCLPELLALSLQQPALPASLYRYILDFLASQPPVEQFAAFGPTPAMTKRLQIFLTRQQPVLSRPQKRQNSMSISASSIS
jgi:hypothetical protein